MSGLDRVNKKKIEYHGYFDFRDLYGLLKDVIGTDYNYEIIENEYVRDVGSGEIEVSWECKKKISGYLRYKIYVKIYATGLEEGRVKKGGRKVKMQKGDIEIHLTAYLETDYEDRWESNAFLKFLKGIYNKYLYKSTYESHVEKINQELWSIADELKGFFQIQS